jgi:hypothetical protein
MHAEVTECGWPWLALRAGLWTTARWSVGKPPSAAVVVRRTGLPIPQRLAGAAGLGGIERLPVEPEWGGLLADTAVLAGVAAVLWHAPWIIRRCFRRRCGLCSRCAYPVGIVPVCTECGGAVRPGAVREMPVPFGTPTRCRGVLVGSFAALAIGMTLYLVTGWLSLYLKGPHGWYGAIWRGQLAVGRANHEFQTEGLEVARFAAPFNFWFSWKEDLVGSRLGVPLWLPMPILIGMLLRIWWCSAVRRTIAKHHACQPSLAPGRR